MRTTHTLFNVQWSRNTAISRIVQPDFCQSSGKFSVDRLPLWKK
ncbi:hypothetical protein NIES2104_42490 [Leptolyngbya sp. NIES-2104]|nr:hypothetical protein NIES2104_42490 [Leptolyngbya sp. NIES-2104]